MADIPNPSNIPPNKKIGEIPPISDQKPKEPTKKFASMQMTKKEFSDFLGNMAKMIVDDIKRSQKRLTAAIKKMKEDSNN